MFFFLLYSQLLIAATEGVEMLDPLIVRPGRRTERVSEYPGTSHEVRPGKHLSYGDILEELPAVTQNPNLQQGETLSIRGQDPIQTRYFLEGIPLTDAQFQGGNIQFLPMESVRSVRVFPDAIPALLGEDGLGGGIDFSLYESPEKFLGARIGSFGNQKAYAHLPYLHVNYESAIDDFQYYDDFGTPFNPADDSIQTRQNNRRWRIQVLPRLDFDLSKHHALTVFGLNSFHSTQVPGAISSPTQGELKEFFSLEAIRHGWDNGTWTGSEAVYFRMQNASLAGLPTGNVGVANGASSEKTLGTKLGARWKQSPALEAECGLGVERAEFVHQAEGAGNADRAQRYSVPLGVGVQWRVLPKWLTFSPALVLRAIHYEKDTNVRGYLSASPRLSLVSQPVNDLQLRATLGHYYRSPSLLELYGGVSGITQSPALEQESADKIALGFDYGTQTLHGSYTFSWVDAQNLIAFSQNSQQTRVASNIGRSRILSQEAALHVELPGRWLVKPMVVWLFTENRSEISSQIGKELPLRSPMHLQLDLAKSWNAFELSYGLSHYSSTYSDLANLRRMDAFWMHRVGAALITREFGRFQFDVQNLTNVITLASSQGGYQTTEPIGVVGYPVSGRRIWLTWSFDI